MQSSWKNDEIVYEWFCTPDLIYDVVSVRSAYDLCALSIPSVKDIDYKKEKKNLIN